MKSLLRNLAKERNYDIWYRVHYGIKTQAALSREFGVTAPRIREIYMKEDRRQAHPGFIASGDYVRNMLT